MGFHHEKLKVYQRTLEFATWSQELIEAVTKKVSTRDQLERAGDSVALNIAEGNGKFSRKDRARFFQIAHGSALECAACLDLLVARGCCRPDPINQGKLLLEEIVRMLFRMLDQLGCRIAEDEAEYFNSSASEFAASASNDIRCLAKTRAKPKKTERKR